MAKLFLVVAAILGGLSVAGGAFASHALKAQLSDRALEIFETGAKYQMYHALALLFVGVLLRSEDNPWLSTAGIAFVVGVALFSGSLYGLSLSGIKTLGVITPLGGVAFLVGWGCLAVTAATLK
ncbi:MAG: DUF423 domain-containing protein [Elainellaceae cyanobacterium]